MSTALRIAASIILNEDTRKLAGKIILLSLAPALIILFAFLSTADAASRHNQEVIDTLFEYKAIPDSAPVEFKTYMETMQNYFRILDEEIPMVQVNVKEGVLDLIQIKTLFLSIYLKDQMPLLEREELHEYVLCFTEEIEAETLKEEDKEAADSQKNLRVLIDMGKIKNNVNARMGIVFDDEKTKIYSSLIAYVNPGLGASAEGEGNLTADNLKEVMEESSRKPYIGGRMGSPFADGWRGKVSSEFGSRSEIILPDGSVTGSIHTGMDLAEAGGVPILAINGGKVVYVRNHKKGLGLHLAIDHGGGKISVYGHTSRIIVKEGDKVKKGQKIAEVGTTGDSTGNHLHLEIYEDGKAQNPRNYLE